MTRVTLLDGAPGAGKTWTLRERLSEAKADGLGVNRFWWLTFTRAGRKDAGPEISDVYTDTPPAKATDRARTLHSLALSLVIRADLLDPKPSEVGPGPIIVPGGFGSAETDPFAAFCAARGMRYDPDAADPRKLLAGDETTAYTGNKLFAVNDFLRQTCKDPQDWRASPIDIDIHGDRVISLIQEWQEYKTNAWPYRLFEHGDYLDLCYQAGLTPDVELLLIDEFQDFAPLEYRLFKSWRDSGAIDEILLAGDVNQSIYSFRGGTPHYIQNTPVDETISLKKSWRCPEEIASVGNSLLSAHPKTDARGFAGREGGGRVNWRALTDKYQLRDAVIESAESYIFADTPVMLLTRTNSQLRRLTKDLRHAGLPFEVLGSAGSVWRGKLKQIQEFLNMLDSGGSTWKLSNVREVFEALPPHPDRKYWLYGSLGDVVTRSELMPALEDLGSAFEIARNLRVAKWKRDLLINTLKSPVSLKADELKVGTIHTSKGLEAPSVFLFTTSSKQTVTDCDRNPKRAAEEHRVYYVGATRASEELTLVSDYFEGPQAPPLVKLRRNQGLIA